MAIRSALLAGGERQGRDQHRDPTCSSLAESLSRTGLRPLKLPYGLRGEPLSEGEEPEVSMGQM